MTALLLATGTPILYLGILRALPRRSAPAPHVPDRDERGARRLVAHDLGLDRRGGPPRAARSPPAALAARLSSASTLRWRRPSLSSSSNTRSTPARFMPSSVVISWIRRSRSTSSCEYRRVPFGERLRLDQPARLVHAQRLRVHVGQLGGDRDHEHAAVVLDPRGDAGAPRGHQEPSGRLAQQRLARVAVHRLRQRLDRLALLLGEVARDVDHEAVVDVAAALAAGQRRRALAAQALDGAVLGAARARAASSCRAGSAPRRRRRASPRRP